MKKILNEWRRFAIKEATIAKTPLEKEIEAKASELGMPYNERLANIKASAHAVHFLQGGEISNQSEYLSRVEFGLSAAERIKNIYNNSSLFADHFAVFVVESPPLDKRFGDTKKMRGVKMIDIWTRENTNNLKAVLGKGSNEDEAYSDLFERFGRFVEMLDNKDYDFRQKLGRMTSSRTSDKRHSGGAFSTGLIVLPTEATDKDKEYIGERYTFYMQNREDPAYIMASLAEKKFQEALNRALSLWRKYPFKDGEEKQIFAGAVIRMERALKQSYKDLRRIESDPGSYSGKTINKEISDEEKAEELLSKARAGDKQAAGEAFKLFRKMKNNTKAREARMLMR
tara:strand:+ start:77 stop:1099 length:1023 start_codon:yes stop_codon:yes gene_type:complete